MGGEGGREGRGEGGGEGGGDGGGEEVEGVLGTFLTSNPSAVVGQALQEKCSFLGIFSYCYPTPPLCVWQLVLH